MFSEIVHLNFNNIIVDEETCLLKNIKTQKTDNNENIIDEHECKFMQ